MGVNLEAMRIGRKARNFLLFLVIFGCVEPYTFVIKNEIRTLVVEAYISDKSFNETLLYPSDGLHFSVRLSYSGDVTNAAPKMIPGASVKLLNDQGAQWMYTESASEPGVYFLLDDDFKAIANIRYKLQITPPQDDTYESDWENMPTTQVPLIEDVSFVETEIQRYKIQAGVTIIETIKGVNARLKIPENDSGDPIYYRWKFTPTWIFSAALTSTQSPVHKCWVTTNQYLPNYSLQVDNTGRYSKELFFIQTQLNERIYEDLSVLVTQFASNERNYTFWRELQEQVQSGTIRDSPPFNLLTNIHAADGSKRASGYFEVVQEQATRWYFNSLDLSYSVPSDVRASCLADPKAIPESCLDCRKYPLGNASTVEPNWWRN